MRARARSHTRPSVSHGDGADESNVGPERSSHKKRVCRVTQRGRVERMQGMHVDGLADGPPRCLPPEHPREAPHVHVPARGGEEGATFRASVRCVYWRRGRGGQRAHGRAGRGRCARARARARASVQEGAAAYGHHMPHIQGHMPHHIQGQAPKGAAAVDAAGLAAAAASSAFGAISAGERMP